jgi:two-component system, NarL family, nitrate/nitrite response regulator NarL
MNNPRDKIAILIADDHPFFRAGLRRVLEAQPGFCVLGEAAGGEQALELTRRLKPRILLLGIGMPIVSGLGVLRGLKVKSVAVRTLILTAAVENRQITEALRLGARGIILKDAPVTLLLKAIRSVLAGDYWIWRDSIADLAQANLELKAGLQIPAYRSKFGLIEREREVIAMIVGGYSNKAIALKIGISEHAVKRHLTSIFDKLGVYNRFELALFSIDHRLVHNSLNERQASPLEKQAAMATY